MYTCICIFMLTKDIFMKLFPFIKEYAKKEIPQVII